MTEITKLCSQCGLEKPINEFYNCKAGKHGKSSWCTSCSKEYRAKYRLEHRDHLNALGRKSYYDNFDKRKSQIKQYQKAHPEQAKASKIKRKYQMSFREYNEMLERQEEKCAICGKHKSEVRQKTLAVDHDHNTGKIRELLCIKCNLGIGNLQDDPLLVLKAYNYLLKHSQGDVEDEL